MKLKSPIYETDRLLLRPVRIEDAWDMYEYSKDSTLTQMAGFPVHQSYEDTKRVIRTVFLNKKYQGQPEAYAIIYRMNQKMIGTVDLHDVDWYQKTGCLGYALNRDYWGHGIAFEASWLMLEYAFTCLQLKCVIVNHFVNNKQSCRVIEKLGFRYIKEKIDLERRQRIRHYEMTKEEYDEKRNSTKI